jgi:hypothetical protein
MNLKIQLDLSLRDARKRTGKKNLIFMSWPQLWDSTSCGFGGVGGRAKTLAQTVIVIENKLGVLVYHNGKYAYTVPDAEDQRLKLWTTTQNFPGKKEYENS